MYREHSEIKGATWLHGDAYYCSNITVDLCCQSLVQLNSRYSPNCNLIWSKRELGVRSRGIIIITRCYSSGFNFLYVSPLPYIHDSWFPSPALYSPSYTYIYLRLPLHLTVYINYYIYHLIIVTVCFLFSLPYYSLHYNSYSFNVNDFPIYLVVTYNCVRTIKL